MNMNDDRTRIARELERIEVDMKRLEIAYEQYFSGIEKREPMKDREDLTKRIRQFANRRIMQTDLRFKYQNIATRFHSYNGHWNRILKLMDEGKYHRNASQVMKPTGTKNQPKPESRTASSGGNDVDNLYNDLLAARKSCNMGGNAPDKNQVASMLEKQKAKIREKFGDRKVAFKVETKDGKPRIVVKAKA
ncbi:MAG: hypothetical protein C0615_09670 [Desulfuromonas sp.]|nr:MAG: hypothetical protein C0615_09670 [Desulfuromonas sp.]